MILEIEEVDIRSNNCTQFGGALPIVCLNHVSLLVKNVYTSVRFYEDVLGFSLVKRPSSFNFRGAWLYNYGIGIHLLEKESSLQNCDTDSQSRPINPKDNHISFQCTDVAEVKRRLAEMGIEYVTAVVEEGGVTVDQVFFHDPDGYMVEICNCDNIPMLPISAAAGGGCTLRPPSSAAAGCGFVEALMMESLRMDLLNFSF